MRLLLQRSLRPAGAECRGANWERTVRSLRINETLTRFLEEAGAALRAELAEGAEVGFELEPRARRRGSAGAALYCYVELTGEFIAERMDKLEALASHREAARALSSFGGLEPYIASAGAELVPAERRARVRRALIVLLEDAFHEQSDFELRPERLHTALERLQRAALAGCGDATLLATLHGLTIASPEIALTRGLRLAQLDAFDGLPQGALATSGRGGAKHLLVVLTLDGADARAATERGVAVLHELVRALRLFGDGRISLGALAWARIAGGAWQPLALPTGARAQGMLVITPDQEDELRAFCSLISRRAPHGDELAWALRRFELGCERERPYEALTDHLLALRALLEPEGPASGLLPGRLAALCATPSARAQLSERMLAVTELERAVIEGTAEDSAAGHTLVDEVAAHLRALLRDVLCGHLAPDLVGLADEILLASEQPVAAAHASRAGQRAEAQLPPDAEHAPDAEGATAAEQPPAATEPPDADATSRRVRSSGAKRRSRVKRGSGEQVAGDASERGEVLDVLV